MDYSLFCKVWLEDSRTIHLRIVYGYFPAIRTKLSSCNGDHMAAKAKNIFYPALYNKVSVAPTPILEESIDDHSLRWWHLGVEMKADF